jgi:glycogen operon protein
VRCIGLRLNGRTLDDVNGFGEAIQDETYLILLNPHHEPIRFYMPKLPGTAWELLIDSAHPDYNPGLYGNGSSGNNGHSAIAAGGFYELAARSSALLRELAD